MFMEKPFCRLIILLINLVAVDVKSLSSSHQITKSSSSPSSSLSSPSSQSSSSSSSSSCPNSCFCDQDNIYVSCVGDHQWDTVLPEIPRTVIRLEMRNYNVSWLDESGRTLSPSYFTDMPSLRELKLQSLALKAIANHSFIGLSHLERLDLSDNQLENLTQSTFSGITTSLKYLDLSSNRLVSIDEAFLGCAAIEQLNLRYNRLTNLTINTFIGLVKLQYLNLDCNHISAIELGSFLHLTRLGHLIISNNPISSVTRFDSMSTHLKFVDVSNISLSVIPHGIDPFIRDLRLAGNQIRRINSGDLDNYLYLNILVLDNNGIQFIEPDSLGRLEYLIKLWLKENKLTEVPLDLPTSLRQLYLDGNRISILKTAAISPLVNLERLSLAGNHMNTIEPECFRGFESLIYLDLSGNQIETLSQGIFSGTGNLEMLDLSENPLKMISPQIFADTINLKQLHLARIPQIQVNSSFKLLEVNQTNLSNLTVIPLNHLKLLDLEASPGIAEQFFAATNSNCGGLFNLPNLMEVNLMKAQLKTICLDLLDKLPQLKTIKLHHNEWDCHQNATNIIKFARWLNQSKVSVEPGKIELKCWFPVDLRNQSIMTFPSIGHSNHSINTKAKNMISRVDPSSFHQLTEPDDDLHVTDATNQVITSESGLTASQGSFHVEPTTNLPSGQIHLTKPSHDLFATNGNISSQVTSAQKPSEWQSIDDAGKVNRSTSSSNNNSSKSSRGSNTNSQQIGVLRPLDSIKKLSTAKSIPLGEIKPDRVEAIKSTGNNITESSSQVPINSSSSSSSSFSSQSIIARILSPTLIVDPKTDNNPSPIQSVNQPSIALPMSSKESTSFQQISSSFAFHQSNISQPSHSPDSPSSENTSLIQFGIVSFIFGSLVISGTLCFAVLTLIKSRKVYSTIGKEGHGETGSWLRRSVSYLSQNDEVSFLSLNEASDGMNVASVCFQGNDPSQGREEEINHHSMINRLVPNVSELTIRVN